MVGFAEEEGQRYKATFLGSGALTGDFDSDWLDQVDADGITMREAMQHAGLLARWTTLPRCSATRRDYLGFVEVHIEQGPVLNELDLPLGIVTSINGSVRYAGEVIGMASHAGTTPMDRRRDAAAAVAELIARTCEKRAGARRRLGGHRRHAGGAQWLDQRGAGALPVHAGPARPHRRAARRAGGRRARRSWRDICERRGLHYTLEETMRAAAAPSAPAWQQRWEAAVAALGLPLHRMPSGAGHDAMKLHEVMPQAMLFVRGQNAGISHNPLESTTSDDMQLAVDAFSAAAGPTRRPNLTHRKRSP